jgi:hypothetical protein
VRVESPPVAPKPVARDLALRAACAPALANFAEVVVQIARATVDRASIG